MEDNKTITLKVLRLLFRPVARILLRAGINWKEIAEVCKATYVEVATQDFGIRGRPTNVSRVALMTGFSRREVRRLRDLLDDEQPAALEHVNSAQRVLSGWYEDDDFVDTNGAPRPLLAAGSNPSFETLCSRYSGDVPATTMLKELLKIGAIGEAEDGRLVAKTRAYIPFPTDPTQMLRSGKVLEDIGQTVAYNLYRKEGEPSRFERRAEVTVMPESAVAEFREYIEKEGQAFLERVDHWLTEREDESATTGVRLGLGTYWIEEKISKRAGK
ncbi:MAG: DUF6502 family protein [Woeseiaceae bacterium]|nr:DUF6502 family protein [Woeseiaceae bacterium]